MENLIHDLLTLSKFDGKRKIINLKRVWFETVGKGVIIFSEIKKKCCFFGSPLVYA